MQKDEIRVLYTVFPPGEVDQASVAALYNEAKQTSEGFEEYAEQLYAVFRRRPAVLVQVLEILFAVALADGELNPAEEVFLSRVAAIFRFPPQLVEMVRKRHQFSGARAGSREPTEADNLAILGLGPNATNEEAKKRYRQIGSGEPSGPACRPGHGGGICLAGDRASQGDQHRLRPVVLAAGALTIRGPVQKFTFGDCALSA